MWDYKLPNSGLFFWLSVSTNSEEQMSGNSHFKEIPVLPKDESDPSTAFPIIRISKVG